MNVKKISSLILGALILAGCQDEEININLKFPEKKISKQEESKVESVNIKSTKDSIEIGKLEKPIEPPLLIPKEDRSQEFVFNAEKDTSFLCEEGTKISVPANAFVDQAGRIVEGLVSMKVTEYYKVADILEEGLTTMSGDKMLESGGMLRLSATSKGEKLALAAGKTVELGFPREKEKKGMQIFYGKKKKGIVDWQTSYDKKLEDIPEIPDEPEAMSEIACFGYTIEVQPEYIGGYSEMFRYISKNFKYPQACIEMGIQGTMYIQFTIKKNGKVEDVKMLRGIHPSMDSIGLNLVANMPDWKPGTQRGKPVDSKFTIPIKCKLSGGGSPVTNPYATKEEIKEEFEEKIEKADSTNMRIASEEVNYYLLRTSDLGWINCDRFMRDNRVVATNSINVGYEDVTVYVLFQKYKTVMPGYRNGKYIDLRNLPVGEKVKYVATKIENGEIFLSISEERVAIDKVPELNFKKIEPTELKTAYAQLNSDWSSLN